MLRSPHSSPANIYDISLPIAAERNQCFLCSLGRNKDVRISQAVATRQPDASRCPLRERSTGYIMPEPYLHGLLILKITASCNYPLSWPHTQFDHHTTVLCTSRRGVEMISLGSNSDIVSSQIDQSQVPDSALSIPQNTMMSKTPVCTRRDIRGIVSRSQDCKSRGSSISPVAGVKASHQYQPGILITATTPLSQNDGTYRR